MASRFSIESVFKLIDKFTAPINKITKNNTKASTIIKKDFAKAQRAVSNFAKNVKAKLVQSLKFAAVGAFLALTAAVGVAAREYVNFDNAITASSAKFKDMNLSTSEGQATLKLLGETSRKVGALTQFTATQAAEGLDFLAMAGFTSQQAMVSLAPTVDLATVANVDLARATDIASDSLGAFGLMVDDTNQLQTNFTRLNDVMAKTMTSTNVNMEDMFESIKKGAPTFTSAGQSLETFNSMIGIMANSGVKGGEAGTQLRNVMLRLADPTKEAQGVLKTLGITTKDQQGNFRDVVDVLADFEKGLQGMGTAQRAAALSTVFGARSVTGINILLQSGTDSIRKFRDELLNSAGASQEMAGVMRQSLGNQINILKSGLVELGFKFIEAFEKDGRDVLSNLINLVQEFDMGPVVKSAKNFLNITIGLAKVLKILSPLIIGIIAGITAYKTMLFIVAAAQKLFNITLATSPIIWIAIAIAALIIIIVLLVKNWHKIVAVMKKVWEWIVNLAKTIWNNLVAAFKAAIQWISTTGQKMSFILGPLGFVFSALVEIAKQWDVISEKFKSGDIKGGILGIGKAILSGLLAPIQGFLELVSKIPGVGDLAAAGAEKINQLRLGLEGKTGVNQVIPPAQPYERYATMRNEEVSRGELTIRDETGRAEMTKPPRSRGYQINMATSGGFNR